MSEINPNAPAFPVELGSFEGHQTGGSTWQYPGISVRDYFAAKAMQSLFNYQGPNATAEGDLVDAKTAYRMADAMLKAREEVK